MSGAPWYEQTVNERVDAYRFYARRYREGAAAQKRANLGRSQANPAYWPDQIAFAEKCAIDCDMIADRMVATGKVLA